MASQVGSDFVLDTRFLTSIHPLPPEGFSAYLSYAHELGFEETPDYDFLRGLFAKVMRDNGYIDDQIYDWDLLIGIPSYLARYHPRTLNGWFTGESVESATDRNREPTRRPSAPIKGTQDPPSPVHNPPVQLRAGLSGGSQDRGILEQGEDELEGGRNHGGGRCDGDGSGYSGGGSRSGPGDGHSQDEVFPDHFKLEEPEPVEAPTPEVAPALLPQHATVDAQPNGSQVESGGSFPRSHPPHRCNAEH